MLQAHSLPASQELLLGQKKFSSPFEHTFLLVMHATMKSAEELSASSMHALLLLERNLAALQKQHVEFMGRNIL